ncbi:monofunctional biosynthetic peptidoglycan transglycosylase [Variovorax guangxiensis]|uniref:monofunctional biosynthetic peptidoglycan transglycosylase n=1 Tax=Variovorax guangxiensis TaxID=1775474 RepID=UPI0028591651|nr:monofunctional biosynthetic peptidoglycan transglycosylase [Variovorax guangxiensis]MDR6859366.1 monofunctional biosynthetic peptidoglycan transglycosylase [Variovorax guangxiensis]
MKAILRWVLCLLFAAVALEVFFIGRIAAMAVIDPQSTAFQRSEAWQLAAEGRSNGERIERRAGPPQASERPVGGQRGHAGAERGGLQEWKQEWVPYSQIADSLKRAVIASEDSEFIYHNGVEWEAVERARQRNERAEQIAARRAAQMRARGKEPRPIQLRGGSTITQQLAKNLLLSGERTLLRKGQELLLSVALELLLDKQRILEIYLNSVEWGEGIFGAEAAAQHYFKKPASRLGAHEAARLAVMLPSPRFFERRSGSAYLAGRTATIVARMPSAELP